MEQHWIVKVRVVSSLENWNACYLNPSDAHNAGELLKITKLVMRLHAANSFRHWTARIERDWNLKRFATSTKNINSITTNDSLQVPSIYKHDLDILIVISLARFWRLRFGFHRNSVSARGILVNIFIHEKEREETTFEIYFHEHFLSVGYAINESHPCVLHLLPTWHSSIHT